MNFIKSFFASVLGTLTALTLLLVFGLLLISGIASILQEPMAPKISRPNSVVTLNLNTQIADRPPTFNEIEVLFELNDQIIGLHELLLAIDTAAQHPNIEGIVLQADFISAGWSQIREIRNALLKFKATGKFIYAYHDIASQKSYYLTSVADSLVLNPAGMIEFKGLASEVLYYKDFQDRYGLKMEVIRHGKYKSAVEPFLENEMSADNRFQIKSLLNNLWETLRNEMAETRSLSPSALDALAQESKIAVPLDALEAHLVDQLGYESDLEAMVKERLGISAEDSVSYVSTASLLGSASQYNSEIKDRIAVVYAQGTILYGPESESYITQEAFVKAFETLAKDDWIKAVVLRVDSPGGSALTSELLWQAIEKVKAKKPVIVSMGNVAASGGYYIAAGADQIFLDPLTVTGSIGVFATLPNASGFLASKGIRAERVETHPNGLGYSFFSPMTDNFRTQTEKGIEQTYALFKDRVAQGRSLTAREVETLAQGRVWSGNQAVAQGLADQLGGIQDALHAAAQAAGIQEYNVMTYPQFEESLQSLLQGVSVSLFSPHPLEGWIPKKMQHTLESFTNPNSYTIFQALLPFDLNIQ
ncbi:MAG: signal peptide peptidase SppA [Bacteroidetes bacterium]|nr:signal peptide peptidase SppA [Bacteroidota bacterium]MDA0922932.1 signal peptide peptidase SppA [Bacteroidota bacterium]MDA1289200.1 signal peptide peptidase SppA [Bacteroidota bacterium]